MPQQSDDHQLLNRYLLGVASDEERETVEEEYFQESAVEELLCAEDELIDDYIRGTLTTSDRMLFEKNFLSTSKRRQRMSFTKDLVEALIASEASDLPSTHTAAQKRQALIADRPDSRSEHESAVQLDTSLTQLAFDRLLEWLDPVRARAAEKYETIRRRLIQMFALRGFINAEVLADHTIDKVARRVPEIMKTYVGDPAAYFYGAARMILLEQARSSKPILSEVSVEHIQIGSAKELAESHRCLEKCLQQLSESNRQLILQYYSREKENKVTNRKDLAQSLGVSPSTLRIRAHRIRASIQKCVTACLEQERTLSP